MKRLLQFLLLLPVLCAAANRETVTVTVTNTPAIGETLVINGTTKTWAASATNSNYIAVGASIGASTTNLWTHYSTYQPAGPVVVGISGTNIVTLMGALSQTMTVTSATNWCALTTATNTLASAVFIRVPFSVEASTNRTNNANQLISDLGANATTAASATAPWLANFASLSEAQTITGAKTMTGANVLGGGTITNMGLGTIRLPYRTNSPSGIILDNLTNYTYAIAPDYAGRPALWDVSATSNLTTYAGAMASLSGGSIMNKATSDTVYGGLGNTNAWTGPNTFSGATGITGSIITNSTISGTVSLLQGGTVTNSTLRSVSTLNRFQIGTGPAGTGGELLLTRSVSEAAVDGDNAAIPTANTCNIHEIGSGATPPTAAWNLVSLADGYPGKVVIFVNDTGYTMSILNESGLDAVATNRIVTATGATVASVRLAAFLYDDSNARWRLLFTR